MYGSVMKNPCKKTQDIRERIDMSAAPPSAPPSSDSKLSWTSSNVLLPSRWRFLPSSVSSARTLRRSFASSIRLTKPSASSRSTSCVTLDLTHANLLAISPSVSGSAASTSLVRTVNLAIESPHLDSPPSIRSSAECAAAIRASIEARPSRPATFSPALESWESFITE